MSDIIDKYIDRFKLTRADYKYFKSLDEDLTAMLQGIIEETYNANGEILVRKYLERTNKMDELMADHIDAGGIEAAIYNDPYRLNIFIHDYPPRLKEHNKTKFSKTLGYDTDIRWLHYMSCSLHKLKAQGAVKYNEKIYVIIKYHFPAQRYDVDNYAIKFINDAIKFSGLITDDDHSHLALLIDGITDMGKKGTEITLITRQKLIENAAAFI